MHLTEKYLKKFVNMKKNESLCERKENVSLRERERERGRERQRERQR
jgi:hypothetical protein